MKKNIMKCAFCLALLLCCVAVFAACGSTSAYKALYKHVKDQGGEIEINNLDDSLFNFSYVSVTAEKKSISFYFAWRLDIPFFNSPSYTLRMEFSRDKDDPVNISYSEFSSATNYMLLADCNDVTETSFGFDVRSVYKGIVELTAYSSRYEEMENSAKAAVEYLQLYVTSILRDELGDYSLQVQDLYDPS